MKKIIAINCSPRTVWNTATLVREAAKGAGEQGVEGEVIDLYKLEKFTGCISCFGCKLPQSLGTLQVKDYSRYNWTIFDPEHKKERHEKVFPEDKKKAFALGAEMVNHSR